MKNVRCAVTGDCESGLGGRVRTLLAVVLASSSALAGSAQSFTNLDFESIGASSISSNGIWLSWSLAAPGWDHAVGGDSFFVYHNTPPTGEYGQYYFLADQYSTAWSPLEGDFSLVLVSGNYNRSDPTSPWVNAWIEQSGVVPVDAESFRLTATGDFSVTINSTPVEMTWLGGDSYGGDISKFQGQTVNLRIWNDADTWNEGVVLDELNFSTQAVPEPSVGALFLVGAGAVAVVRRGRRGPGGVS